jgi:hypothetical protein
VVKVQVSLQSDNHNGRPLYMKTGVCVFVMLSGCILLRWEMVETKVAEKMKSHILCSISFVSFENLAVREIMWGSVVELDSRPQILCGQV